MNVNEFSVGIKGVMLVRLLHVNVDLNDTSEQQQIYGI